MAQEASLVACMKALTDSSLLTAAKFSNPFGVTSVVAPVILTNVSVTIQYNHQCAIHGAAMQGSVTVR